MASDSLTIAALMIAHEQIATALAQAKAGQTRNPDDPEWETMTGCYGDALKALEPVMALIEQTHNEAPLAPPPVRIVLDMTGGVMQGASIDGGAIDLLAVDYDAFDGDATRMVPQIGGTTTEAETTALGAYMVQPEWVAAMFADHEAAHREEDA